MIARASFWRVLSTATFVAFLLAWALEGFDGVPGWGWIALIVSGVTFAIEMALVFGSRSRSRG